MVRALHLVIATTLSCAAGCALVSGLSDLDVGDPSNPIDASVDQALDAPKLDGAVEANADAAVFDASPPPTDAGDAATCGPPAGDGPVISTSCITGTPLFGTGTIPTGVFDLSTLRFFQTSCTGFVSTTVSGRLVVTAQGSTLRFDERITMNNQAINRSYEAVVNGNAVDVKLLCGPPITVTSWGLNLTSGGGNKNAISFVKDDGQTKPRYIWN